MVSEYSYNAIGELVRFGSDESGWIERSPSSEGCRRLQGTTHFGYARCRDDLVRTTSQAALIEPSDLLVVLGGLPEGKGHFATMAAEAMKKALEDMK